MIPFFPFYGYPNYGRFYPYKHTINNKKQENLQDFKKNNDSNNNDKKFNDDKKYNHFNNVNNVSLYTTNAKEENFKREELHNDDQVFDFLGLKLGFDDLLILAVLYFLYKEETKDPYLYVALILLLLS